MTGATAVGGVLAHLADEQDNLLSCIRCGACLTSCPTYVLTRSEIDGPRGRIAMLRSFAEGEESVPSPELIQAQENCLACDACSTVCPAGVHMGTLQVAGRAAFDQLQPALSSRTRFLRWLGLRQLLPNIPRLRQVVRLLSFYQRSGLQAVVRTLGLAHIVGMGKAERLLPKVSSTPFVPQNQTLPATEPRGDAAFFAGCVMSTALADLDRATTDVLQRDGLNVLVPAAQGCCGALNAHSGDLQPALEMAKRNIVAFESQPETPVVVNAAGCGAFLKEYAHHFASDPHWADRAAKFSARVRDISEVLTPRELQAEHQVTVYQDACHLLHAQGIRTQPRQILKNVDGLELKEIAEPAICCGSAGIYNLTHPEAATALRDRKVEHCLAVGAELVVTGNPGCLLQLQAGFRERGSNVQVKHLAEVLATAEPKP
jgi:glycolate oxidase iron-sulfur subunit